jgi:hypothetical protein
LLADNRVFGILDLLAGESDAFDTEEVGLLSEMVADLAYGVLALRAKERAARAEAALKESKAEQYATASKAKPFCNGDDLHGDHCQD